MTIAPAKAAVLTPQQQPVVAASQAVHPITQAAEQAGVLTCTSRINQISNFLTTGTRTGAVLSFASNGPDQHTFSASLEIIPPSSPSLYASTSFTPTPSGGCDAVYDTVQFLPQSCSSMISDRFKLTETPGVIKRSISIVNAGTVKFFLMPAGANGCVVIKKEVVK